MQRVGAVNTVFVAFPGIFGALAARLPVQDLLGFSNQAIVLVAIARELGIDDHREQVRLLAKVLCNRTLGDEALVGADDQAPETPRNWSPFALARTLWHLAGILRAIGDELEKRPQPKPIFRYLGMLPAVGSVAGYIGEYGRCGGPRAPANEASHSRDLCAPSRRGSRPGVPGRCPTGREHQR